MFTFHFWEVIAQWESPSSQHNSSVASSLHFPSIISPLAFLSFHIRQRFHRTQRLSQTTPSKKRGIQFGAHSCFRGWPMSRKLNPMTWLTARTKRPVAHQLATSLLLRTPTLEWPWLPWWPVFIPTKRQNKLAWTNTISAPHSSLSLLLWHTEELPPPSREVCCASATRIALGLSTADVKVWGFHERLKSQLGFDYHKNLQIYSGDKSDSCSWVLGDVWQHAVVEALPMPGTEQLWFLCSVCQVRFRPPLLVVVFYAQLLQCMTLDFSLFSFLQRWFYWPVSYTCNL